MHSSFLVGLLLAVLAGVLAAVSGPLSLETTWPLLLGAGVMLVPAGRPGWRLANLIVGFAAAWVGFALRAAVLPDVPLGRGLAVAAPILIVTAVAAATRNKLPLWAGLLGIAGYTGAYEAKFIAAPTDFIAQSFATMASVLLAVALGAVLAAVVGQPWRADPGEQPPDDDDGAETEPLSAAASEEARS